MPLSKLSTKSTNFSAETSSLGIPVGTSAQQPSPAESGDIRFNSETGQFEGFGSTNWVSLGGAQAGGSIVNRIINGDMRIDQRNAGASQTFTAGAALAYCVDRWYGYCTGANVTGQRVAGSGVNQYRYQFTGAASVTKIGFAQRIEAANCYDLNGQTVTLAVDLANSLLTTVTWTAWYANTADTFGTLASPTRTQIATGTFTVTSTVTRYSTQISIPSAATTGIEVEFSVGAQTSGTFTIGNVQLETGSVATRFERRPYGTELALCQRYYEKSFPIGTVPANGGSTTTLSTNDGSVSGLAQNRLNAGPTVQFKVTKRTAPTMTKFGNSGGDWIYGLQGSTALVGSANSGLIRISENAFTVDQQAIDATVIFILGHWTASAEL